MTAIRGALSGTHPLSEELVKRILDFKYGRDTIEPVREFFQKELAELVSLQESAGFPIASSGSLGLEDLIRPFTRSLDCFQSYEELGDLPIVRWHYTNTFYRKPRLVDKFPNDSSVILKDKHSLSGHSAYSHEALVGKESKIVIPGPVTLVSLIDVGSMDSGASPYSDLSTIIEDAGRFLAQEVSKLPPDYQEIQFDEPVLVWRNTSRQLIPSLIKAYEHIKLAVGQKNVIVNTYFGDAMPILSLLLKLPVDGLGVDFLATNPAHLTATSFEGKILQAGILNAENYVPTQKGDLDQSQTKFYSHLAESLIDLNPDELILTSNTSLEYLPRPIADSCIWLLASIVKEVQNNGN
ncbi:MAG: hypothetical protein ACXAB4_12020 [Candidatus Hodarchaeales archaeon]|jgi:5-methyltetrahydropteroyltriglutamate--homocysteine methyltransferase